MGFVRARSEEEINSRQDEILRACDTLFTRYGYQGVNLKAISNLTSFTRPTIYHYYRNKEEILLALLQRELVAWKEGFLRRTRQLDFITPEGYCHLVTESFQPHAKLYRLLTFLFSSMEENSRVENLRSFYRSALDTFQIIDASLGRFFPNVPEKRRMTFRLQAVSLCLGLHSLTSLSDKQATVLKQLDIEDQAPDFADLFYQGSMALISTLGKETVYGSSN